MRKAPTVPLSFCCADVAKTSDDARQMAIEAARRHSWSTEVVGVSPSRVVNLADLELLAKWQLIGKVVVNVEGRESRWYYFPVSSGARYRAQIEMLSEHLETVAWTNESGRILVSAQLSMVARILDEAPWAQA
jgi:sigma54-dependent transcription regulator